MHHSIREREQRAGINTLFAKLNEIDAFVYPSAHLILQRLNLRGVYEASSRAIRDCTTEHPASVSVSRLHWPSSRVGL